MAGTGRRLGRLVAVIGVAAVLAGCARTRAHQGYVIDPALVASVSPGVDNKESVEKTLGRPSFVGEFAPQDWYYVSRETRQFAFGSPKPIQQTVIHVHFDAAGNVASVQRSGLENVASIRPNGDKTPTLGRHQSFFQEIFGNIGTVGGATKAPTADNPG